MTAVTLTLLKGPRYVVPARDVAVRDDRDGEVFLDFGHEPQVCGYGSGSFILTGPPMHCDDLRARILDHLSVSKGLVFVIKHANLGSHRNSKILVQVVDEAVHSFPIIHQEAPVPPPLRNALRAAKVEVDCITPPLNVPSSREKDLRIIGAELRKERAVCRLSILRAELLLPVVGVLREDARVEHGCVA
eukprot:CAMPEP_0206231584 /NCGR_PEP_ID=MMETSP0047_2-20121206/10921_1 /ASSEMBLY_ACC=CAM_ASM_000192 /TAXON_ID=195065 /ORGANISM="Chroomonas mesostigmatica_cf, Strain CCMP1168" /LENGTH=188 /DNA_ID=CAMNT_0053655185 /DNA_START=347 /DNA_END=912 /DNA_ORIENTATION=-